MKDDLTKIRVIIDQIGSKYRAAQLFGEETGYNLSPKSMSRVYRGEAKPALIAFVRYGLEQYNKKRWSR